jgi:hypothetical protein
MWAVMRALEGHGLMEQNLRYHKAVSNRHHGMMVIMGMQYLGAPSGAQIGRRVGRI